MNDWKELSEEDYEIERITNVGFDCVSISVRYRKRKPKAPTHEEIMSKWWKYNNVWFKVERYTPYRCPYLIRLEHKTIWVGKEYFNDKKSALIPPEAS